MLSIKDLVFVERPVKKLTERYVEPYVVEEVVSNNVVKLKLPVSEDSSSGKCSSGKC